MRDHPLNAARPLRRRSFLGLLGATPLAAAGGLPTASGQDRCGAPPADLLPGGAYDRYLTAMAADDRFSGTVLLAHAGRPVLSRSFGWADKSRGIPNRAGTLFNLESVTKVFTAVAVAQLAAQGKIDFFGAIGGYLDTFPAQIADTVTVHQLLTHTAGMDDYPRSPTFAAEWKTWTSPAEVFDGIMRIIPAMPLVSTPGTGYRYSNSGFYILGAIVARVSGQSYYDYVRDHIFAPAGMTRTGFHTNPQLLASREIAHPYATAADGRHTDAVGQGIYIGGPDEGAYSNGPELLAFARALQDGTLLPPAFAELTLSGKYPVAQATGEPTVQQSISIGYGVENLIVNDHRVVGHPGGGPGGNTDLDIYPDLGWFAAVLGNYNFDVPALLQLQNQLITQQGSCGR
jgi:CubicO group peptidase (beta-lactamase class C family)